jgi:hypothetical protein
LLKKVYGFSEQIWVPSTKLADLRVQVQWFPLYGQIVPEQLVLADSSGPPERRVLELGSFVADPTNHESVGIGWVVRPRPVRYVIENSRLSISVDLLDDDGRFNPGLDWRITSTGAPYVKWVHEGLAATIAGDAIDSDGQLLVDLDYVQWSCSTGYSKRPLPIQLQLLLVARPPDLRAGPVEREWLERCFVTGGLPSLGKRR